MTNPTLESAILSFAIQDVFLVESRHTLIRAHNPQESVSKINLQMRHGLEGNVLFQERQELSGQKTLIMRRFVSTGFRLLNSDTAESDAENEEHKLAEIECVFAADYLVKSGMRPAEDLIVAFDDNVVFHVWPYWREFVQSTLARSRLPSIALPMFRLQRKAATIKEQPEVPGDPVVEL